MSAPLAGNPWHGLVYVKDYRYYLKNAHGEHDVPFDLIGNGNEYTHLIHVPGTPDVMLTPAEKDYYAQSGWRWQNKNTLLQSEHPLNTDVKWKLNGKIIPGPIYCDPTGGRWSAKIQFAQDNQIPVTGPVSGTVTLATFGEFNKPHVEQVLSFSLSDLGQQGEPISQLTTLRLNVFSVSPSGDRVIVRLVGEGNWGSGYHYTVGWLMLQINGTPPNATAVLTVLRNRTQTIGVLVEESQQGNLKPMSLSMQGSIKYTHTDANNRDYYTFTPDSIYSIEYQPPGNFYTQSTLIGSGQNVKRREDAVRLICFNELGQVVEFKYTAEEKCTFNSEQWTGTFSGEVTAWRRGGSTDSLVFTWGAGDVLADIKRRLRVTRQFELTLKRFVDGVEDLARSVTVTAAEDSERTAHFAGSAQITIPYAATNFPPATATGGNLYDLPLTSGPTIPVTETMSFAGQQVASNQTTRTLQYQTAGKSRDWLDTYCATNIPMSPTYTVFQKGTTSPVGLWDFSFDVRAPFNHSAYVQHLRRGVSGMLPVFAIAPSAHIDYGHSLAYRNYSANTYYDHATQELVMHNHFGTDLGDQRGFVNPFVFI